MHKHRVYAVVAWGEALLLAALVCWYVFRGEDGEKQSAEQGSAGGVIEFSESFEGLDVSREYLNTQDNTTYDGSVEVLREKLKKRSRVHDDVYIPLDQTLKLYGPYQQNAPESLFAEPFLEMNPVAGKIETHLDNSGEYTIQITPRAEGAPPVRIKMSFRRVDADGREWELVWKPYTTPQSDDIIGAGLFLQISCGSEVENK